MDYSYRPLNDNYLISEVYSDGWKYGIVDKCTGVEYIAPVCNSIHYNVRSKLLIFEINSKSKCWQCICHIDDFDSFVSQNF